MNFRKKLEPASGGIQMAPMIDIIFILLIHFMAATIFAQWEQKMDITVPTADTAVSDVRQPGEVIINIDSSGVFYINSREISDDLLYALLSQISGTFKTQPIIIRADEETPHKHVMRALDLCRKADIWNIAFSCIKHEENSTP